LCFVRRVLGPAEKGKDHAETLRAQRCAEIFVVLFALGWFGFCEEEDVVFYTGIIPHDFLQLRGHGKAVAGFGKTRTEDKGNQIVASRSRTDRADMGRSGAAPVQHWGD
jgi:hypothetical protein